MKKQPVPQHAGKKTATPLSAKPKPMVLEPFVPSSFPNWIYIVIIALCFALYGNTMLNQYALDDTMVLTQNQFVKEGFSGIPKIFEYDTFIGRYGEQVTNLPGGRYRPLSVATLAVEYSLFVDAETKQLIKEKLDATKPRYTVPRRYLPEELIAQIDTTRANELKQLNEWRASALAPVDTAQHPQAVKDIEAQYAEALAQIEARAAGITYAKNPTELNKNDDDAPLYMKTALPYVNHFVNILLFAVTACFLFKLLLRLFPVREASGWKRLFNIPVIATLLFVAHPVHVEAVANIKGRDEIMTFLGALMALFYTLRWVDTKNKKFLFATFICFLAGTFSKENAITFLVIIPFTLYFIAPYKLKPVLVMTLLVALPVFLSLLPKMLPIALILAIVPIVVTLTSKKGSAWRSIGIALLPSFVAAFVFTIVRYSVINLEPAQETELMNNPFLDMNSVGKWASIIYVLGRYLLLLFWPHPLTTDYYPYHIPKMTFGHIETWLVFFAYVAMAVFAIWGLASKRKDKYAYAIIWFVVPLSIVSNIFVMIGTFMNERFVYISSVGFCVALALFLLANLPKWIKNVKTYRLAVGCFLAVVLVLYSVQTISRNRVWFDDFTLSTTDVKTSPKSAKANYDAARVYNIKIQGVQDTTLRNFYTSEIHKYSQRAVKIHPNYENALFLLSWSHSVMGSPVDTSLKYMKQLLRRNPQNPYAYDGLTQVLGARVPDPAQRAAIWEDILTVQPLDLFGARVADQFQPNYILACIYAKEVGDIGKSLPYFEKAATLNPGYVNGLIDLGAIYGLSGNHVKAVDAFRRAVQVAPTDTLAWRNLWYTYRELGEYQHSQEAYQKYREMGGGL